MDNWHTIRMMFIEAIIIMVIVAGSFCTSAQDQKHLLSLDELIDLATFYRDSLRAIDIRFTVITECVKGSAPQNLVSQIRARILQERFGNGKRYYIEQQGRGPRTEFGNVTYETYNGGKTSIHYTPAVRGAVITAGKRTQNVSERNPALYNVLLLDPAKNGMGVDDGSLVSLLRNGRVRSRTETVNGRECHVVDGIKNGRVYMTVWIDVERSMMPLKVQIRNGDRLYCELLNVKLAKVSAKDEEPFWLPTRSVRRYWMPSGEEYVEKYKASSIRINPPLSDDSFTIKLPTGTRVFDMVANIQYDVPGPQDAESLVELAEDIAEAAQLPMPAFGDAKRVSKKNATSKVSKLLPLPEDDFRPALHRFWAKVCIAGGIAFILLLILIVMICRRLIRSHGMGRSVNFFLIWLIVQMTLVHTTTETLADSIADKENRASSSLSVNDIPNWPRFLSELNKDSSGRVPGPGKRIWEFLPPEIRTLVQNAIGIKNLEETHKLKIVEALNNILNRRDFYTPEDFKNIVLSDEARRLLERGQESLSEEEVQRLNRLLLDAFFSREIIRNQELSCGPVCLVIALRRFGLNVTVKDIMKSLSIGNDESTTLVDLADIARRYGIHVQGVRLTKKGLANLKYPALLKVQRGSTENHCVLFCGVENDLISIIDPLGVPVIKRVCLESLEEDKQWAAVVLSLNPINLESLTKGRWSYSMPARIFLVTLAFVACLAFLLGGNRWLMRRRG